MGSGAWGVEFRVWVTVACIGTPGLLSAPPCDTSDTWNRAHLTRFEGMLPDTQGLGFLMHATFSLHRERRKEAGVHLELRHAEGNVGVFVQARVHRAPPETRDQHAVACRPHQNVRQCHLQSRSHGAMGYSRRFPDHHGGNLI